MSRLMWVIFIIALITIGYSVYQAIQPDADIAGWVQVGIAALGIPILLREIIQIRTTIDQKPIISVGLGNVNDLPLSKIRNTHVLNTSINVSRGYAHFWLLIRNQGKVAAKSIKVHFEFKGSNQKNKLLGPVIESKDWLNDKRYTFKKVNNADFVFIGGENWILHANDTDMFDFHISTVIVKNAETKERERPDYGDYQFVCTIWADGLDKPISENLAVRIVDKIK